MRTDGSRGFETVDKVAAEDEAALRLGSLIVR
jgi:hypothetical protein